MTELPDNILHLPQYQVLGCKSTDDEMHFQVDVPDPIACEECGVQGEFVRFGKRDVPYRDLPIHGKRVTLWVVRRRYTCRACKTTFRPQLPEMVDGFRMTLRLHEYVEKESFNHPYTFVAAQTGLDEKTVRDIFNARAEFLGRWHRFETPRILGIDELYLNKRYRCILTNIEERTLLDLLATRRQDVVTNYLMKLKDRQKVEIVSMDMWNPYRAAVKAVLPQARIVVDKFHVVRMANDALGAVDVSLQGALWQVEPGNALEGVAIGGSVAVQGYCAFLRLLVVAEDIGDCRGGRAGGNGGAGPAAIDVVRVSRGGQSATAALGGRVQVAAAVRVVLVYRLRMLVAA